MAAMFLAFFVLGPIDLRLASPFFLSAKHKMAVCCCISVWRETERERIASRGSCFFFWPYHGISNLAMRGESLGVHLFTSRRSRDAHVLIHEKNAGQWPECLGVRAFPSLHPLPFT